MFLFRLQKHVVFEDILFSNKYSYSIKQNHLDKSPFCQRSLDIVPKSQLPAVDDVLFTNAFIYLSEVNATMLTNINAAVAGTP